MKLYVQSIKRNAGILGRSTLIYSARHIGEFMHCSLFRPCSPGVAISYQCSFKDTKYIHLLNSVLRLRSTLIAEFVRISSQLPGP